MAALIILGVFFSSHKIFQAYRKVERLSNKHLHHHVSPVLLYSPRLFFHWLVPSHPRVCKSQHGSQTRICVCFTGEAVLLHRHCVAISIKLYSYKLFLHGAVRGRIYFKIITLFLFDRIWNSPIFCFFSSFSPCLRSFGTTFKNMEKHIRTLPLMVARRRSKKKFCANVQMTMAIPWMLKG